MIVNTKFRSEAIEIMDDFDMTGNVLKEALDKIAQINQLLGGNKLTLQGLKKLLVNHDKKTAIKIIDVGCGNGDMLREIADFGLKNNFKFDLIGVDANLYTIEYAQLLSKEYYNLSFICEDIFDKPFSELKYDIVVCTLTLHHFKNEEIQNLLKIFKNNSSIGIVINDLHRSRIAYYLFHLICFVFRLNYMSKQDGLTSILRGFKKNELIRFSKKLNFQNYIVQWKWAFRYQWIIKNS